MIKYFRPSVLLKKWHIDKPNVYNVNEHEHVTETEGCESPLEDCILSFRRGKAETFLVEYTTKREISVTIGTWNVAGRHPYGPLDIGEWLCTQESADMYVIGFQEVVALNAGNVLGAADSSPIPKWETTIYRTLNQIQRGQTEDKGYAPHSPVLSSAADEHDDGVQIPNKDLISGNRPCSPGLDGVNGSWWPEYPTRSAVQDFNHETSSDIQVDKWSDAAEQERNMLCPRYVRLIGKQMVGIYVSIWVHQKLRRHINNLKVSPVGVGLMGYVRNKGSVSVSMSLFQTKLCFVCSHLTSGQKDGHRERRNRDVSEILRRTKFPSATDAEQPKTIPSHNQIFWFGDLNYRLDMGDAEVRQLVAERRWDELIKNDQLYREMGTGCIFDGWKEGRIYFAPTYKYKFNSDKYSGEATKEGEKHRSPAWCDRILWFGKGIRQISYTTAELKLSDHRPVSSMFLLEVDVQHRLSFS
ncbi:type I inositol polyphosphate 5-phosphatase 2-like isoform X2 [Nymphaea colorata]|nr:type I inositol polyphosphate 5-phosphatase 2-like isoform X2 [Nymphaea colorata]